MKKTLTLLGMVCAVYSVTAQDSDRLLRQITPDQHRHAIPHSDAGGDQVTVHEPAPLANFLAESGGTVIWSETFASGIPATWSNSGLTLDGIWEYRGPATTPSNAVGSRGAFNGTRGPLASPSAGDGFVIFDSDFLDNNGDPNNLGGGIAPVPHDATLTTEAINFTGVSGCLRLCWVDYFRNFETNLTVEVSTDNGLTWPDTIMADLNESPTGIDQPNGRFNYVNVGDIAAGQANVRFRFRFRSVSGNPNGEGYYFWMLDDIVVSQCPNNDLALNEHFFNGAGSDFVNTANINYYDQVPKKQANSDILTLGGAVSNEGSANQPNARINVTVSGPPPAFSGNSSPTALLVDSSDFLDATATFVPGNTVGPRSVVWWVASDSTLAPGPQNSFLANDTLIQSFRVSDRVYAWDDGNSIGGNAFNNGSNYGMFQRYEFQEDDTITSVLFNWFNNTATGTGSSHGSIVTVSVYPVTGNTTIANGGGIDLTVPPLAEEQFVSLDSNDFNMFSEVVFTTPAVVDVSAVQEVLVGFSVVSGSAWISVESFDDEDTQVQQTFVDVDNDDVIDGFSRRTPFIRINMVDNQICQNTNINITTASVVCQPNFEADIDITVGGNPNGNVAFAWSGPNGFAATTEDVTVDAEGVYTVTVTDQSNCSNTHSVTVDNNALPCNVSVPELDGSALQLAIYPNPGDGEVILTVSNTPRHQFQLEVHNMMGQLVYSDQVVVHDGAPTSLDLRKLGPGAYALSVTDGTFEQTAKLIIR